MKKTVNVLYYIFFISAIVLIGFKIYLRNNNRLEEVETVEWLALSMVIGALICRLIIRFFPKWFNNKPAREEIEKQVHGE